RDVLLQIQASSSDVIYKPAGETSVMVAEQGKEADEQPAESNSAVAIALPGNLTELSYLLCRAIRSDLSEMTRGSFTGPSHAIWRALDSTNDEGADRCPNVPG
ncbi:unnamed protein product, partial [Mycena citricolor]